MKVGDLVRIKRASLGVPVGCIGLVVKHQIGLVYDIQFVGMNRTRRLMPRHVEVINESR